MTKIVHYSCVYNESQYVRDWIENVLSIADTAVIYDDGSTDDTYDILREYLPEENLPRGKVNDWSQEFQHFGIAFRRVCELNPSHIIAYAADERIPGVLTEAFKSRVKELKHGEGLALKHAECYRSTLWWRGDGWWSSNAYARHWAHDPAVANHYSRNTSGVHRFPVPLLGKMGFKVSVPEGIRTVHLGWSSEREILRKFGRYADLVASGRFGPANRYTNFVRFLDETNSHYNPMPTSWTSDQWIKPSTEFDDTASPPKQKYDHGWLIDRDHKFWKYIEAVNPSASQRLGPRRLETKI